MIPKSIQEITAADIDALVANGVAENNRLDFKQALIGATRDDKKEFIADICAFANAQGGDLVFGVQEDDSGQAQAVVLLAFNADNEILRLENMVADGIEPRLFGLRLHAVAHAAGQVLVARVPKSIQGIHRSKLDHQFYVRESRSKRSLDVAALSARFEGLADRRDRFDEFLAGRYAAILTDQLPMPMQSGPKLVLHIFQPFASADQFVDVAPVAELSALPLPGRPMSADFRMSYEGPLHYSTAGAGPVRAYTLTHHNGVVEGCVRVADPERVIWAEEVEQIVVRYVRDMILALRAKLPLDCPFVVRVAIIGGQGMVIQSIQRFLSDTPLSAINRSALVLPDAIVPSADADIPIVFRPAFDRLWHVSGYLGSHSYRVRDGVVTWTQNA